MILILISAEAAKYCSCIAQRSGTTTGGSCPYRELCHLSNNSVVRQYQIPLADEPAGAIGFATKQSPNRI